MNKKPKKNSIDVTIAENLRKHYNLNINETLRKTEFREKGETLL